MIVREPQAVRIAEPGLAELFTRLADDTGEVIRAEVGMHKARALGTLDRVRGAAIFFVAAALLAIAALIALLVGIIMSLTPAFGPALATLTVVVVTLALAGGLAFVGKNKLSGKAT